MLSSLLIRRIPIAEEAAVLLGDLVRVSGGSSGAVDVLSDPLARAVRVGDVHVAALVEDPAGHAVGPEPLAHAIWMCDVHVAAAVEARARRAVDGARGAEPADGAEVDPHGSSRGCAIRHAGGRRGVRSHGRAIGAGWRRAVDRSGRRRAVEGPRWRRVVERVGQRLVEWRAGVEHGLTRR